MNAARVRLFACLQMAFVVLGVAACAQADRVDWSTILSHGNCQADWTGVREIDAASLARLRGTRLIGVSASPDSTAHPRHLVAILPGEFPTAGYAVGIRGEPQLHDGVWTITVKIEQPPRDAMLAQMITRPCLVVGISTSAIDSVRVFEGDREIGRVVFANGAP